MTFDEFKAKFHIQLNSQQDVAAQQISGPVLLLAVPGSGKTTVLVTRLGYMIYCRGIAPRNILTMTYTTAATADMRARFASIFGSEHSEALEFRTINGICSIIINRYARVKQRTPFTLISDDAGTSKIIRELFLSLDAGYPTDQQVKEVKTLITYCKNMLLTEEEIRQLEVDSVDFFALYQAYRTYMTEHRLMDYDDQMVIAHQVLKTFPDILDYFQQRYPYLCVDEAQDTSKIQHLIIRLLASKNHNLFMVGDEDQSIYGFRAAFPQALLEFETIYPEAKVLLMEQNYRSTQAIVTRANEFIKRNKSRHDKHMHTENEAGTPIRHTILSDYQRQYNYIAKMAEGCTESTAILYRNNDSAIPIIDLLERKGIPYRCRQRESFFFSHYIVRDITDIIRFAFNPNSRELFLNLYYKFDLHLKKSVVTAAMRSHPTIIKPALDLLIEHAKLEPWQLGKVKALRTHLSKLPELTAFTAINRIVHYMGYGDYLDSKGGDMTKVNLLLALANQNTTLEGFLFRLEELKGIIDDGQGDPACPFVLSTIHSSKGLEYDRAILIDVIDGIFPSVAEPVNSGKRSEEDLAALEEERRLFYVGVTRGKKQVELFGYKNQLGSSAPPVSSFVMQLLGLEQAPSKTVTPVRSSSTSSLSPAKDSSVLDKDYLPGTSVTHKAFGTCLLQSKTGGIALLQLANGTVKKVDLRTCLQKDLIRLTVNG